jgi:hypothetical protein
VYQLEITPLALTISTQCAVVSDNRSPSPSNIIGSGFSHKQCEYWDDSDDVIAKFYAFTCPGYKFFDWDEFDRLQAQAEAEIEKELSISETQQIELDNIRELNEQQRLISIGLLDKTGEPTDEYYRLSDQQYDARR